MPWSVIQITGKCLTPNGFSMIRGSILNSVMIKTNLKIPFYAGLFSSFPQSIEGIKRLHNSGFRIKTAE
jgi:hypothetical protein